MSPSALCGEPILSPLVYCDAGQKTGQFESLRSKIVACGATYSRCPNQRIGITAGHVARVVSARGQGALLPRASLAVASRKYGGELCSCQLADDPPASCWPPQRLRPRFAAGHGFDRGRGLPAGAADRRREAYRSRLRLGDQLRNWPGRTVDRYVVLDAAAQATGQAATPVVSRLDQNDCRGSGWPALQPACLAWSVGDDLLLTGGRDGAIHAIHTSRPEEALSSDDMRATMSLYSIARPMGAWPFR